MNYQESKTRHTEADSEMLDVYQLHTRYWREFLANLDEGNRIILDDVGDVTDDERKKAKWLYAFYAASAARIEFNLANDNEPAMDEELADMLAGNW